jgi:hypothetical protein
MTMDVLELRVRLWQNGYHPLPLEGKVPPMKGWQNKFDTNPEEIALWSKSYNLAHNTGVLTGDTPCLDIDITDEAAAEDVEHLACDCFGNYGAFLVRIGKPPKRAIFFRTETPFKKLLISLTAPNGTAHKIEFLGDGQQAVVDGVHPETGRPYVCRGGTLVEVRHDELPGITEERAREFLVQAAELLVREHGYKVEGIIKADGADGGVDDTPRADWAALVAKILAGKELHDSIRDFAASHVAAGLSRDASTRTIQAVLLASGVPHDERWQARFNDVPRTVASAYEKFARVPQQDERPVVQGLGEWNAGDDDKPISPRGWLLGNVFCRRYVSSLLGDGGVGKTAVRYAQFVSVAISRALTGEHVFQRCRVLIVSLEDDVDELRRRIRAVLLHHGVKLEEVKDWLFLAAPGAAGGKLMTLDKNGRPTPADLAAKLEAIIVARKIDLVALDPFVKSHAVAENDNPAIDQVVQILTDLGVKHDIAVDTPHHTNKGTPTPGDANRGRGASSMKDAARLVYTLSPMMEAEAQQFGLSEFERRHLVRMDPGKVNIAPPMHEAKWFRLVGVSLGNPTELYPNGDNVQTVEPWTPPDVWAGLDSILLNRVLTDIDAGLADGNRYSNASNAGQRAAWCVIVKHAPEKSQAAARAVIAAWIRTGLLYSQKYKNPDSKFVFGLHVDPSKRPT